MNQISRFGEYEIDRQLFQIRWRGRIVPVERRVFDLVVYLLANSDRVVTKDELFQQVWSGRVVSPGSLTVAIAAARKAFRDDPANPQIIITHRGRGYRFSVNATANDSDGPVGSCLLAERSDPFIGRDNELRALSNLLDGAAARARFAVLMGDAGIGKSRLIDEFARVAQTKGARTVVGRCREEEGAPSFWPWIQIARTICSSFQAERASQQLVADAPEIAQSIPELRPLVSAIENRLPAVNARFRLFDGFARFIGETCKESVLVILLDDVHRADNDSLLLLEFLLDSLHSASLVVIATHRPADLRRRPDQSATLARVVRKLSGVSLQLLGLSGSEISRLVRGVASWSPSADQIRALEDLTGGNPFFLSQLASILGRDGVDVHQVAGALPATVRDAIAQHIQNLTSETRALLVTASIVGRQFESAILARAHRVTHVAVANGLAEAIEAGVVSELPGERGSYRFVHALVRDVLYQSLSPVHRTRLHGAVGEALDRDGVRDGRLAEVAIHYVEAAADGNVERAVESCCAAAESARKAVAFDEAVEHRRRALRVLEQHGANDQRQVCSILLDLGSDQLCAGGRDEAKQTFDRAARLAEAVHAPEMIADAALGVAPGFFAVEAGVRDELLISLLRRAQSLLGQDQGSMRAMVLARLAMALFWSDDDGESARLSREAWQIAESAGDSKLSLHVLMSRWLAEWTPYNSVERCAMADDAIDLARLGGDKETLIMALLYGLVGSLESGNIGKFDERAREFKDLANDLRQPQAIWYSKLIGVTRDLHSGRFLRAEEGIRSYFEIGRRIDDANAYHSKMAQSLIHASERGDASEILAISEQGRRRYPVFLGWHASRCWALARAGKVEAADEALKEIMSLGLDSMPRKLDWPTALAVLSETSFLLKRVDIAEQLHGLLLPMRGNLLVLGFCVMTWGPVSRYLGLLNESLGRLRDAAEWYEQALEEGRRSAGEPWVAHAGFGLYRVQRAMGRDRKAFKEIGERSRDLARRLGMSHLDKAISAELA